MQRKQGWEFTHWFPERIARFLRKNEQMSDLLKKTSDLLKKQAIRSFFVSNLSNSAFAHGCSFLVSDLSKSLTSLIKKRE